MCSWRKTVTVSSHYQFVHTLKHNELCRLLFLRISKYRIFRAHSYLVGGYHTLSSDICYPTFHNNKILSSTFPCCSFSCVWPCDAVSEQWNGDINILWQLIRNLCKRKVLSVLQLGGPQTHDSTEYCHLGPWGTKAMRGEDELEQT